MLKMYLKCFLGSCPQNWVKLLTWAEFCYNTSYHSSIRKTLFEVVYERAHQSLLIYVSRTAKVKSFKYELLERDAVIKEVQERITKA